MKPGFHKGFNEADRGKDVRKGQRSGKQCTTSVRRSAAANKDNHSSRGAHSLHLLRCAVLGEPSFAHRAQLSGVRVLEQKRPRHKDYRKEDENAEEDEHSGRRRSALEWRLLIVPE